MGLDSPGTNEKKFNLSMEKPLLINAPTSASTTLFSIISKESAYLNDS
jgi:hypothetical protein